MNNDLKLYGAFAKALNIRLDRVSDTLSYNTIPEWDSVAHMALIAELEATFDVMLDTDDIIGMSSVAAAKEILEKRSIAV